MATHGRTITPNDRYDCVRLATSPEGEAYDKLPMMETADSNGSHANETDIIDALNSTSNPNSFFNSGWFVVVVVLCFFGCILLTNLVFGL